ncbi:hypothetical protein MP228_007534 [Amoeboaphelidium protococcarum]|nr:hypothetical protein MP228_007534 [Amoeboaphelidium protococcarum]
MSDIKDLQEKQKLLIEQMQQLRAQNASDEEITPITQQLKDIKMQIKKLSPTKDSGDKSNSKSTAKSADASKNGKITVKTPKGTIDYKPADMAIREKIFQTITTVFKRHGSVTIDTPVFELKEILQGKYGEDSKLIYDLADQGGELCSLRYDLTVPFARYLATNTDCKTPMKRYHIAKVYRRDQPVMTKGRMREFYQCDYDIAGVYERMVPDSECVRVMCEILKELDIGQFVVKINHRQILDGMFEACGVPADKFRSICSAVDKLDKMAWSDVKNEMIIEKGLNNQTADAIGEYVKLSGGSELIEQLLKDDRIAGNTSAKQGLDDMKLMFKFLDILGVSKYVRFDLSLARGLDYYTGVIYEAIVEKINLPSASKEDEGVGVGSIAGGGRYDNLVGMFAQSKNSQIPCVGFSVGVERIYSILKYKHEQEQTKERQISTDVYVASIDGLLEERMKICAELWDAGISADFMYKNKPKLPKQFDYCDKSENQIPWCVIIGSDEVKNGQVRIKDMKLMTDDPAIKMGVLVKREDLVQELASRLKK